MGVWSLWIVGCDVANCIHLRSKPPWKPWQKGSSLLFGLASRPGVLLQQEKCHQRPRYCWHEFPPRRLEELDVTPLVTRDQCADTRNLTDQVWLTTRNRVGRLLSGFLFPTEAPADR